MSIIALNLILIGWNSLLKLNVIRYTTNNKAATTINCNIILMYMCDSWMEMSYNEYSNDQINNIINNEN